MSLGHQLYWSYRSLQIDERELVARRLGIEAAPFDVAFVHLFDACAASTDLPFDIDPTLRSLFKKFSPVIDFMHRFYSRSRADWSESTRFDDELLANLLADVDRPVSGTAD